MRLLGLALLATATGCSALYKGVWGDDGTGDPAPAPVSAPLDAATPVRTASGFGASAVAASGLVGPTAITHDDEAVFLLTEAGDGFGDVLRVNADGVTSPIATHEYRPRGIQVDGLRAYWAGGDAVGGHTYIRATDKRAGGLIDKFYDTGASSSAFTAVALDGETLAWANRIDEKGSIWRGTTAGTASVEMVSAIGQSAAIAVARGTVYWSVDTKLFRMAATAAAPELVTQRGLFTALAADGDKVYAASDDGTVLEVDGAGVRVVADGLVSPRALAVDADRVYVVSAGDQTVIAVPRDPTGPPRSVLASGTEPYAVAATSTDVWFTDRGAGTLVRIPRR